MIIGINYNTDGTRYIAAVYFLAKWTDTNIADAANVYKALYDEVYIINFHPNYKPLIEDIVLNGCRIS